MSIKQPSFVEGDLRIVIRKPLHTAINFDAESGKIHGLTHCMKSVDFIFEDEQYCYYIEFKDLDNPNVPSRERSHYKIRVNHQYAVRVLHRSLRDELVKKFRDTFLYRWAQKEIHKPVKYCILLCHSDLDAATRIAFSDDLKRHLPQGLAHPSWKRPIVDGCAVFDLKSWNRTFPHWHITRISEHD